MTKIKWKDVRWGMTSLIVLSLTMAVLEYYGAFAGFEGRLQDLFWLTHGKPSPRIGDIVVLTIDDDAYKKLFDFMSPLDSTILTQVVCRIAESNPALIGVDVLTESDGQRDNAYPNFSQRVNSLGTKVVWIAGQNPDKYHSHAASVFAWMLGKGDDPAIQPTQVLGLTLSDLEARPSIFWGPAINPTEQDLKLRRFPQRIRVCNDPENLSQCPTRDSFAMVIAKLFSDMKGKPIPESTDDGDIYLKVAGKLPRQVSLWEFFRRDGKSVKLRRKRKPFLDQITRGKMVLIGGTFKQSRDFYETPEGSVAGVFIHARAISAELGGRKLRDIWEPLSLALDLILGTALIVGLRYEPTDARRMIAKTLVATLLLIVVSMIIFWASGYFYSVAAILIAAVIQLLVDFWHEDPKIEEQ